MSVVGVDGRAVRSARLKVENLHYDLSEDDLSVLLFVRWVLMGSRCLEVLGRLRN
jgi:hypothetical protein